MKYVKILGLLAVAAAALMALAASASATIVTTTTGGTAATPSIHAVNEPTHVKLENAIAKIECNSTVEGTVSSHGAGVTAKGNIAKLEWTSCTNSWHVTTAELGSLEVHWTSGHNGTLYSTGTKVATTRFLVPCVYKTAATKIGTVTGGNPATLHIEAEIPIVPGESSELCIAGGKTTAKWEGSYTTTTPLYVGGPT